MKKAIWEEFKDRQVSIDVSNSMYVHIELLFNCLT